MDNYEQIKKWLESNHRTSFSCHILNENQIILAYRCGHMVGMLRCIEAYIQGDHCLTGKKLNRDDYLFTFSAAHSEYHRVLPLYGNYTLHFDAVLNNGTRLNDFVPPYQIRISNLDYKPYIRYSIEKGWGGWQELTVESNCYSQLNGKLWIQYSGYIQKLPNMESNIMHTCFAIDLDEAQLLCINSSDGRLLPKPIRM